MSVLFSFEAGYLVVVLSKVTEIHIGGAGDSWSRIVAHYVDVRRRGGRAVRYFTQSEVRAAVRFAREEAENGRRLAVIAHSWGCDTALRLAWALDETVDLLVGVDPVSKPGARLGRLSQRPPNIETLLHVAVRPIWADRSDYVKALGKLVGPGIPRAFRDADARIALTASHADYFGMMRTADEDGRSVEDWIEGLN